ncbi:MAG: hypothetical protein Fur0041_12140 [Bacteroidia bacterium]
MTLKICSERGTYYPQTGGQGSILYRKGKFSETVKGFTEDGHPVIIKKLTPALRNNADAVKRFLAEASIPASHPGLVSALDAFEFESDYYVIRAYAEGHSLRNQILTPSSAVQVMLKVLDTLHYLHRQQIIHSDIRPDNIIYNGGEVKLIDLGLAKTPAYSATQVPFSLIYSSPEQVLQLHELVNPTSDVYSLGITLYELLTGKPAFHHAHPEKLMHVMLNMPLAPHKKIRQELFEVILKATARKPFRKPPHLMPAEERMQQVREGQELRYADAEAMKTALSKVEVKEEGSGLWRKWWGR